MFKNNNIGNPLNAVTKSAKPKKVAPTKRYCTIGLSVTGPIKTALTRAGLDATKRMKKVDEFFEERAGQDHTPLGDKQLKELDQARSELQKSLIYLQNIPKLVEAKLNLPEFLKEPTAKAVTTEMNELLSTSDIYRTIKSVRNKIDMITQEANVHGKTLSPTNFDEESVFQEFQELIETEDNEEESVTEEETENELSQNSEEDNLKILQKIEQDRSQIQMLQEQKDKEEAEIQRLEQLQQEELGNQETHQKLIPAQRFQDIVTNTTVVTKTDTVAKIEEAKRQLAQEKLALANRTPMVTPINLFHKADNHPLMDETMYAKPASPQFSSPSSYIIQSPPMDDFRHEINESIKALEEKQAAVIASSVETAVGKLANGLLEKLSLKKFDKIITDVKDLRLQDGYYDSDEDEAEATQYMNQYRNQNYNDCYVAPEEETQKRKQTPKQKSTPKEHIEEEKQQYTDNIAPAYNKKYENFEKHLIKFDGSGKLSIFKRLFIDNVVNNPTLSDDEKYVQLEKHLIGPAAKCMQKLDNTSKAIGLTFFELEQVYGQTEDRMDLHERLINLPFHQTDCKRMILDLQAHRTLVNLLEEQHVNVNDERTITPFCQKLPEFIIDRIVDVVDLDSSSLTFDMVHDAVVTAIKTLKKKNTFLRSRTTAGLNEIPPAHGAVFLAEQQSQYPQRY
ncbi:unnamed protein product [Caenorhabditis nigoni]